MNLLFIILFSQGAFLATSFLSPFLRPSSVLYSTKREPHEPKRKYPLNAYYERWLKSLHSKNLTLQDGYILGGMRPHNIDNMTVYMPPSSLGSRSLGRKTIILSKSKNSTMGIEITVSHDDEEEDEDLIPHDLTADEDTEENWGRRRRIKENDDEEEEDDAFNFQKRRENRNKKSENFEVLTDFDLNFTDIGGYDTVKQELYQIIDLLKNADKYSKYNVRVPKGLMLSGEPGNGKTYISRALAGEAKTGFILVSGSQFQEKYVGVGASRIRELFALAKKNRPCIIFIDEIDALGRKRTSDGEVSASERDSTLNELLVAMDGFQKMTGVFVIGATNRVDLIDKALMRPGRIDKQIHIGEPDTKTREKVVEIHIRGKPHDDSVTIAELVEYTKGLSCAQIENLLNEAMLHALREKREIFTMEDMEDVMNKIIGGWQPTDHEYDEVTIHRICVHEMGHAMMGMLSLHHANVTKVVIQLSSPKSPGYTVFETSPHAIHTREALQEHLMILLGGRIAEEIVYGQSVTTGAINDFEEAYHLAERMVNLYGMGENVIYPFRSEKYKEQVDEEINELIQQSYRKTEKLLRKNKLSLLYGSHLLNAKRVLKYEDMLDVMNCEEDHVDEEVIV